MNTVKFLDEQGTFTLSTPENYSYLYFPVAGEKGIKSVVTPNLGGDSKLNQNAFILEPVSVENLHNNRSTRNFWCVVEGEGIWSAVGQSAEQEADKFTDMQDESFMTAGLMWHSITRKSKRYPLQAVVESFVPLDCNVEVMAVKIKNTGDETVTFTPVAAVPIYGRSADNIRDHRHVTSLLHRIKTTEYGVFVRPTLSFDERGHQKNKISYFVCGITGTGKKPAGFYPVVEDFLGEGGTFTRPRALLENRCPKAAGEAASGKEALGGICFEKLALAAGEEACFTVLIGATEREEDVNDALSALETKELVEQQLKQVKKYWQEQVNVFYHTGDKNFDNYMRWVSFQPFLRRVFGCSFLPYHDYGKGGRGWRDLWQDCLALLMMNPGGVRQMILDNYAGVRIDGTNATIIGEKQGEFVADRNNITRVWMDHGVWPFMTTKFYIDQTGDLDILNQEAAYFKDRQVERGTAIDEDWNKEYGCWQKDEKGEVYKGTVLEHLLLQNLCSFYEVGEHNHIRLRGADWNDALDMAEERGESVAFTCAYAGNLQQLAYCARMLKEKCGRDHVMLLKELADFIAGASDEKLYDSIDGKHKALGQFVVRCRHDISGEKVSVDIMELAENLEKKAAWMMEHIRKTEWVTDSDGDGWFNSYYDNHGNKAEGVFENQVRMMLTGQVFALMSKTATPEQMISVSRSAKKYLYDAAIGGYRINTDFEEEKYDMGRMFGFAYGEKENGAVFSHMTVMFANALYKNGMVKEGYETLKTLADVSLNFETSKLFPGIPEYFNNEGRGMYSYLTGAASWYMMTVITEAFGIRGELGNLVLEPKLVKEQFDEAGIAAMRLTYAGKELEIEYHNPDRKDYGEYRISANENASWITVLQDGRQAEICRSFLEETEKVPKIQIKLI